MRAALFALLLLASSAHAEETWPELDPPHRVRPRERTAQRTLDEARGDVRDCFAADTASISIDLRTSPRHPLHLRVRARPRSEAVEACAELAVRERLGPILARDRVPFSRGALTVR